MYVNKYRLSFNISAVNKLVYKFKDNNAIFVFSLRAYFKHFYFKGSWSTLYVNNIIYKCSLALKLK